MYDDPTERASFEARLSSGGLNIGGSASALLQRYFIDCPTRFHIVLLHLDLLLEQVEKWVEVRTSHSCSQTEPRHLFFQRLNDTLSNSIVCSKCQTSRLSVLG